MKLIHIILRFFFGLFLIVWGLKGLSDVNVNKGTLTKTVELFEYEAIKPFNLNVNLHILKQHPIEILYFENLCIIYGGFLTLFGFSLAKAFLTSGFLLNFIFVNNIYFYKEEKTIMNLSLLAGLLGGILNVC